MNDKISKLNYLAVSGLLGFLITANFLWWHNQIVALAVGGVYLLFFGSIFGSIFIPEKGWQILFGILFMFAAVALTGGSAIYLYQFNAYFFVLLIFLIPAILATPYYYTELTEKFSLWRSLKNYLAKFDERREPKTNFLLVLGYLISAGLATWLVWQGQTVESIQSPWQVISRYFFVLYFSASTILTIYLLRSKRTKLPLTLIVLHGLLSSGIAVIVYQIGYGFDPFIHQASEKIILTTGTITPRPLYYLGQYGLVIFLHYLTSIDYTIIDRILVPAMFAIFSGPSIFYVFSQWLEKKYALVLALAILIMPYGGFIMTAPQNFANLLFLITIVLSFLYYKNQLSPTALWLLVAATLVIHPLAGIPLAISIFLLMLFKKLYHSYRQYLSLYFLTAIIFTVFIPLALALNGSGLNLNLPDLGWRDLQWLGGWLNGFDLPLNLVYLININKIVLAGAIVLIGLIYIAKYKLLKNNSGYLVSAMVVFIDFIIVKYFMDFSSLREYDQESFTSRLLTLAFYVLIPFFLLGVYLLIKKLWEYDWATKLLVIIGLAGLLNISLYLSYPRLNNYEPAKFFSLSAADLKAVNYIEQTANPNHLVLANQMVGAAAIKEFGFKKYFGEEFYYSLPNGNAQNFYNYYLAMVYQDTPRQTMEQAMSQARVSESYFVLNQYWKDAEKIAAKASAQADDIIIIDGGKIYIFKYRLP
ncbi:MAG: hypothetical protein RB292_02515 [Patescibacteria group bacterium]|jgi:hypothetical protein|nr:hypothetical protein [Patescibacteria group bacterium]